MKADAEGATASVTGASAEVQENGIVSAAKGDASVTATAGDATIAGTVTGEESAKVSATGGDAKVSGTVTAKDATEVTSADKSVKLSEGGKVAVTGGAGTTLTLNGKTGVEGAGTVDAKGATLDVDAAEGDIKLTGTVLAKDAAFDAKDISVYGESNDFTGDVEATATAGSIEIRDANALTLKSAGSAKDVRVVAGGDLETTGAVNGGENVLLESTGGSATLNGTATAGKNLTVSSKGATTANKKVEAGEDLYVKAGGDIAVKAGAKAGQTMALVSGGKIEADSVDAKTFHSKDENGVKIGTLSVEAATFQTKGDFETKLAKDAKLAVSAGGNVTIDANGNSLEIGASSAAGGAAATVTEVLAGGGTAEAELAGTGTAAGSATGLSAGKNATVKNAKDVKGTGVEAKSGDTTVDATGVYDVGSTTAGNSVDLDVGGNVNAGTVKAGGKTDLDIGGNATIGTLAGGSIDADVKGSMDVSSANGGKTDLAVGGNLKFDTLKASTLTANAGSVAAGAATVGGAATITSRGAITDNGSEIAAKNLTMTAGGDIGSSAKPITTKTTGGTLAKVSGNNVYLKETGTGPVTVGSIEAKNRLELTAPNIGGNDPGNRHGGGFVAGGGTGPNIKAGAAGAHFDVAGRIGTADNPMRLDVAGPITMDSGTLHGGKTFTATTTSPSYLYVIAEQENPEGVDWDGYLGDDDLMIPGLVIVNGQIYAGHPDLIRRVNRALAFTVETPELKSKQGVFGSPLFVHTDMDVSEAASIGSVDYLQMDANSLDPLQDPAVRRWLRANGLIGLFKQKKANPTGLDALYTKDYTDFETRQPAAEEKTPEKSRSEKEEEKKDAKKRDKADAAAQEAANRAAEDAAGVASAETSETPPGA